MTAADDSTRARALLAFRIKADALFAESWPETGPQRWASPSAAAALSAGDILHDRLADVLARLGADPVQGSLSLSKTLVMHDGRIVARTGGPERLGPDEHLRIVTTTTTVLDSQRLRVETTVLVFEREVRR